jgi:hypothetical protein
MLFCPISEPMRALILKSPEGRKPQPLLTRKEA